MRLINVHTYDLEMFNSRPPEYVILSHRWREEEILFQDIEGGKDISARKGYTKFLDSCRRASSDGFDYIWIDTCCIDKSSSAELSEAINSMYQWYKNSALCYAYLDDVDDPAVACDRAWASTLVRSEWFTRGWTLQELIAPRHVQLYTRDWQLVGSKVTLAHALKIVTGIPIPVLCRGLSSSRLSIAQIMSWAANRVTTRVEDQAYSLMGLFGVFMPVLYGEGKHAFRRLQLEIMRTSNDQSIFAWDKQRFTGAVLADSPSFFTGLNDVRIMEPEEFMRVCVPGGEPPDQSYTVTNSGIRICLPIIPYVIPQYHSSRYIQASLACCRSYSNEPLKVTLLDVNGRYERALGTPADTIVGKSRLEVVNLAYEGDGEESGLTRDRPERSFEFHPTNILSLGFVRCCIVPEEVTWVGQRLCMLGNEESGVWHAVITYVSDMLDASFQLVVGYHLGQKWVHVMCNDDHIGGTIPSSDIEAWTDYSWRVFERMWGERRAMATLMKKISTVDSSMFDLHYRLIQRTHIPGTAVDVVLFCDGGYDLGDYAVKVDVQACPGGCSANPRMFKMLRIETPHSNVVCRYSYCYQNCHEHCLAEPPHRDSPPSTCEVFGGSEGETVAGTSSVCLRCGHLWSYHSHERWVWRTGPEIEMEWEKHT